MHNPHDRPSAEAWGQSFFRIVKGGNNTVSAQPTVSNTQSKPQINKPTTNQNQNKSLQPQVKKRSSGLVAGLIISILVAVSFLIATIVFYDDAERYSRLYYNEMDENYENKQKLEKTNELINEKEQKVTELEQFISDFSNKNPIEIKRIEFANKNGSSNTIDSYGSSLYSNSLKYLYAKIHYKSYLKNSKNISVYIKVYNPDGSLKKGSSSPSGYSFSSSIYINGNYDTSDSEELTGWGNSSGGTYRNGYYRYEIWYNDKCIGSKKIYIY